MFVVAEPSCDHTRWEKKPLTAGSYIIIISASIISIIIQQYQSLVRFSYCVRMLLYRHRHIRTLHVQFPAVERQADAVEELRYLVEWVVHVVVCPPD